MIDKIISGFTALKDLIVSGFEKVLDFFNFLVELLGSFLDFLLSWFSSVWSKFLELVYDLISPLGDTVLTAIPDLSSYWGSNPFPGQVLGYVNTWVNLNLAIELIGVWFVFIGVFLTVKLTIKLLIPGLG